ncbi:uncharacterized protein LOC129264462 isoform X1 [Lytechinus pictus]|uniref:uncharacterized protein LOC129264462 isoform X1 n=1 Tax=Lytechinus pictus TaxID=7653 RepID=UPI0030B9BC20
MIRAERSRHAAKMRRDKETEEISALSKLLPYPEEVTRRLDKGSIIRLTTSYLRMKKFSQREGTALLDELKKKAITAGPTNESCKDNEKSQVNEGALMLQALNGFILFVSRKGGILYVSENVGKQIGIHQYDMIGNSIMDFIHPDDQKELAKQFVVQFPGHQTFKGYGMEKPDDSPTAMNINFFDEAKRKEENPAITDFIQDRHFFLRMKSVVSRRSIGGKGKVVGYRVVNFSGRLKLKGSSNSKGYCVEGLICLCRPIQPQPILEIRMDGNMFMSRHGLDMSFTFCDPRIITLVGYEPHEVIGKTAYQFHNPLDARKVSDCHSKLIVKGSSMSKYYRFLGKLGEWVWMQTKATIIYNTNNVAQYVVCMNYVIGKDEGERHLLMEQMQHSLQGVLMSDSDSCGSPCTPGTPGTPGTPTTPGTGSCSDFGEASPKIVELKEEELAELVPQPVRENQVILKPVDESSSVSFKDLIKESKQSKEEVAMDVCVKSDNDEESKMQCDDAVGVADKENCQMESDASFETMEDKHPFAEEIVPLSKSDSPASDVDSLSSGGSGSVCSPPSQEHKRLSSFGEAEERELLNLLDITTDKPLSPMGDLSRISTLSFTVPSPDNLSQILSSPGTTSLCADGEVQSPNMSWLVEDDEVFTDKLKCPANNILLNLLNEPPITEKMMKHENAHQTIKQLLLSSGKNTDTCRNGSGLPADLADFSLEYAPNGSCNQTPVTISQGDEFLGGVTKVSEGTTLPDIVEPQVTNAMNSASLQTSISVAQPTSSSQYSDATSVVNSFVAPVCSGQSIPPTSNGNQVPVTSCDSHVVTEGMSKLEIQDLQNQKTMHSMLKALLTGAEKNPLSTQVRSIPQQLQLPVSDGMDINDVLGPITPSTKAAVDTLDSLIQDHTSPDRDFSINNNRINHDDLTLLQQQQQQKEILERDFMRQQQMLRDNHRRQQQMMEEEHRRQIIQRQALQQQMAKQVQLKLVNGSVQNGLPQNIPHNGITQNGTPQSNLLQNNLQQQNGLPQQNGLAEQNGCSHGPNENGLDITGISDFDFQQQLNAVINTPPQQQQQQQQAMFQSNGMYNSLPNYHLPPQQQNGFSRQPAPYQQGSPPIGLSSSQPNNFPLQSSQNSSLLAACLMSTSQHQQPQQQQQQQPIQQSLPPLPFQHPNNSSSSGFNQQSSPVSHTTSTLAPSDWQGRVYMGRSTGPSPDMNSFPEPCVLGQQIQF